MVFSITPILPKLKINTSSKKRIICESDEHARISHSNCSLNPHNIDNFNKNNSDGQKSAKVF